jgi:SAM-dependent methyltransferase
VTTVAPLCREPVVPILALGDLPLANALVSEAQLSAPEQRFPLTLAFCKSLALVQIIERIPPTQLFSNYPYFSSMAGGTVQNAKNISERLIETRQLDSKTLVIEIASNDGYLLQHYKVRGIPVLGIEPAANIARVADNERGIPTLVAFFDEALGLSLATERRAAVIHANNVFAHVPDPIGFLRGIAAVLAPNGVAVIEVPYVKDMLDNVQFDTIYHEHLFYYSLTSVSRLCALAGLKVTDVERLTMHGGSLRLLLSLPLEARPSDTVEALLAEERRWGAEDISSYLSFSTKVESLKQQLCMYLSAARNAGQRLAGYGASAKGTTLLNYCNIDRNTIDFVVDQSPYKQGYFTPGTHLPILEPKALLERQPDAVLLLAWNFADEIIEQQAEYRKRGGKFIVPLPQVRLV